MFDFISLTAMKGVTAEKLKFPTMGKKQKVSFPHMKLVGNLWESNN